MNSFRWRKVVTACGCLWLMAGCAATTDEQTQEATGRVQVVMTSSALSSSEISFISTQVSSPSWARTFDAQLTRGASEGRWVGSIDYIPVGNDWTFSGQAYDNYSTLAYAGMAAPVTIEADKTAYVQLNLDQVPPAVPNVNSAPRIQVLTATAIEVQPTDVVTFGVRAVDPDGDYLTYEWSAASGSFESIYGDVARWTAPRREGVYPVELQVYDSRGLTAMAEFKIHVLTTLQEGRAEITATVNTFPTVQEVFVKPGPVPVGEPVSVGVAASDADGDALTYAWTSTCEGTFDATDIDYPEFTLAVLPEAGSCTFTVVVDDGRGGTNYGSVDVAAGENPDITIGTPPGISITAPGEAYAYEGSCDGWNAQGAADVARIACTAKGYGQMLTYGREGFVTEFEIVNELFSYYYNYPYSYGIRYDWSPGDKSWCGQRMAVTEIVCR